MKVKKKELWVVIIAIVFAIVGVILIFNPFEKLTLYGTSFNDVLAFKNRGEEIAKIFDGSYYKPAQDSIDIEKYTLHLDLDYDDESFSARIIIDGNLINNNISEIPLNFKNDYEITRCLLNGTNVSFKQTESHLLIDKSNSVKEEFSIEIEYEGEPSSKYGSFNFEDNELHETIYTLNEPNMASSWFPCNDRPDDKVQFEVYIKNDSNNVSVSNGVLVDTKIEDDKKIYHWKTIYPISTYLISIYSTDYKIINDVYLTSSGDTLDLQYYVFDEHYDYAKIDFEEHKEILDCFTNLFGDYPFIKEKYGVAEFLWQYGAMENQTITGIGSNFLLGQKFNLEILVHELAHHWWGNAVGPKTWADIWLNEGFSTYSEALFWECRAGSGALESTMQSLFGSFDDVKLYLPKEDMLGNTVYNKGAWVLHMLRREIGDEPFFNSLRYYYEKYKYKNASTDDFVKVCEANSNKDLTKFFDQWVYNGIGIPEIQYSYSVKENSNHYSIELTINQHQEGELVYNFPLDLSFTFGRDSLITKDVRIKNRENTFSFELPFKPRNIQLDPNSKLLATIWEADKSEN